MSTIILESEDVELENILQQVFIECGASLSASTTIPTSDDMPIFRIIKYIQDQLPTWPLEHLLELWKCLIAISTNDHVNFQQFKEATKHWISKIQQMQDNNNNVQEKPHNDMSGTTVELMKTDMDKDITEFEFRMRVRKLNEENASLREELIRAEELVTNLERQRNNLESQLDRYVEKCQQLEQENDDQKDKLNEAIKKEKISAFALQRSMKEQNHLLKQLETAEIEMQAIPSLKDQMMRANKEKINCQKQITELQEGFYEKEEEYEKLKVTIANLQDISSNMKETYENTICNLREKNHQLTDENIELQSWSALHGYVSGERLSISIPEIDGCYTHSTPCKSEQVPLQDSLYAELKASGFTDDRSDSWRQELERELDEYDATISTVLKELEKVLQNLLAMRSSINIPELEPLDDIENIRTYNIKALKHKIAFLLNMVTEEITRRNTRNSSTQLRADSNAVENCDQFGVTSFQNLLTQVYQCPNAETNLQSIASQRVNDNDLFLKVIRAKTSIQEHSIDEFVEELNGIIKDTINPPINCKSQSATKDSRCRLLHTLPSNSLLLNTENTEQILCRTSGTNFDDDAFARGDSLTQESGETFVRLVTTHEKSHISNQEGLDHSQTYQSNEIPQVSSALEMDSRIPATLEETNEESFQMQKISDATTTVMQNPRRKISVYYRSFDVVKVHNSCENKDQESILEVRQSLNTSSVQNKEEYQNETTKNHACDRNIYAFSPYRSTKKTDSDSSNSTSPQAQFQDTVLDNELPIVQSVPKKVFLAPTRLKFPHEVKNEPDAKTVDTANLKDGISANASTLEFNATSFFTSPVIIDRHDNTSPHFSTLIMEKCGNVDDSLVESDATKIVYPEDPHSRTSVKRVAGGRPRVAQSVDSQMSSRGDTSVGSDSDYEPAKSSNNRCLKEIDEIAGTTDTLSSIDSTTTKLFKNALQNDKKLQRLSNTRQGRRQRFFIAKRSFSEGENDDRIMCRCRQLSESQSAPLIEIKDQSRAFPSLADARLQMSGIANLSDTEASVKENLTELELQKRYTAFSLFLSTDRMTLPRRMEVSLRQRDQSEKNLSYEVQKMLQNIQELAPLCTDRESVERVEKVRHQLDMIARCVHRVSCAAEALGAVQQEHRVSRAILLADRYLQLLQSRCEKLAISVAETKRVLIEHNIVIEENSGELCDDLPRIRYKSGISANNRIMMARRRASVATMSRPMGSTQDVTKDTMRQRNSVSGRVTLRRPSLNYESSKWEIEKLDCTDSSSSVGELRGIFEHTESPHCSREENNNMLRLSQSNNQSTMNSAIVDNQIWTNMKQDTCHELFPVNEDADQDHRLTRLSRPIWLKNTIIPWRTMLWSILIFLFGLYINRMISMANACGGVSGSSNRWSLEEFFKRYIRDAMTPHPM